MVTWAWIKGKEKPVFNTREISKGKDKGKIQVEYFAGIFSGKKVYRKAVVNQVRYS